MQNLKLLPEGVSGICAGRVKKKLLTDQLERLREQEAPNSKTGFGCVFSRGEFLDTPQRSGL